MAWSFSDEIHALAGYDADSTSTAVSGETFVVHTNQWLTEGAREVINNLPDNLQKLCTSMQSFTSAAAGSEAETLNTGKIFGVFAGSVNCRLIANTDKYRASDSGDVLYATSTDPAYYIESNYINVLPASLSCKYEEVAYPTVANTDTGILVFPDEAEHLVVLYAATKALQYRMQIKSSDLPSDSDLNAVPPDVPSLTSVTFTSIDSALDAALPSTHAINTKATVVAGGVFGSSTAPDYITPTTTITGEDWVDEYPLAQVDLATPLTALNNNVDLAKAVIDSAPVPPDSASAFSLGGEFDDAMGKAKALIDDAGSLTQGDDAEAHLASEDSELVASTVQIASQELQRANLGLQDAVQTFTSGLGQFSAEVQAYQAEVAEMSARAQGYIQTAQGYANEVKTRLSATQTKIGEYQARVQDALNVFNEANASFQGNIQEAVQELQVANQRNIAAAQGELQKNIDNENRSQQRQFQNSINDMKAIFDNNAELIQKFGVEIQEYQAEVGAQVQEYTQNLQADGVGYQWLQDQYTRLKAEYDQAFMIAAPKPQPQEPVRR